MPARLPKILRLSLAPALAAGSLLAAHAALAQSPVGDVFYIELENHNFTQPSTDVSAPQQLFGNSAAPYLNNLITPGNPNAVQTSYASAYHNVLATPTGIGAPSIHPSEPNYVWQEAGVNGPLNDADPYPNNLVNAPNLSGLLQNARVSWKSYDEDIDLTGNQGAVLPQSQWTVPTSSLSGTSSAYTNAYNGSNQYNFAAKHVGQLFFTDTNGGTATAPNTTLANPEAAHYAPLQQFQADLTNNAVSRYNVIVPDQYNDMHSSLSNGFTYNGIHYTGDSSQIAAGDHFLSVLIPQIMASQAYQNNGVIVLWNDETEGANANDFSHTSTEIVISKLAKGNAFNSAVDYTHS